MLRYKFIFLLLLFANASLAQELFAFSEPASNMPTGTLGARLNNSFMRNRATGNNNYALYPEVMLGISKKIMVHVEGIFNDNGGPFEYKGVGAFLKYRFYSKDAVHSHFRLAAFGRVTTNSANRHTDEISSYGQHSGYLFGAVGTQLLHRTAISGSVFLERALAPGLQQEKPSPLPQDALNYIFSSGHLFFPKKYTSYRQTNCNLMFEVIGQKSMSDHYSFIDVAPSLQFIFNSQTRLDIGWRTEAFSNMHRMSTQSILIRVEHIFYKLK